MSCYMILYWTCIVLYIYKHIYIYIYIYICMHSYDKKVLVLVFRCKIIHAPRNLPNPGGSLLP